MFGLPKFVCSKITYFKATKILDFNVLMFCCCCYLPASLIPISRSDVHLKYLRNANILMEC